MNAFKLSLAALLAASSFSVFAANNSVYDAPYLAQNHSPCPYDYQDCPNYNNGTPMYRNQHNGLRHQGYGHGHGHGHGHGYNRGR